MFVHSMDYSMQMNTYLKKNMTPIYAIAPSSPSVNYFVLATGCHNNNQVNYKKNH